jgi:DNA-binding NarL/FixJ family response regulator
MRVQWEQRGLLLPVYRLAATGLSNAEIAIRLNIIEPQIQDCMRWLLKFLDLTDRNKLSAYASGPPLSL